MVHAYHACVEGRKLENSTDTFNLNRLHNTRLPAHNKQWKLKFLLGNMPKARVVIPVSFCWNCKKNILHIYSSTVLCLYPLDLDPLGGWCGFRIRITTYADPHHCMLVSSSCSNGFDISAGSCLCWSLVLCMHLHIMQCCGAEIYYFRLLFGSTFFLNFGSGSSPSPALPLKK